MGLKPHCFVCKREAHEIEEYREALKGPEGEGYANEADYVRGEEGTYNPMNGLFRCTSCYILIGMPSSPRGWRPKAYITVTEAS